MDYSKVIVNKPWGWETAIYQSPEAEVWLLNINKGEKTSMHCHPNKKTSLAVVGGCAKVNLLSTVFPLLPSEKINIRPTVFHQTECWSSQGALVIELESPPDKTNLVRMRDKYGRAGKPYETEVINKTDFSTMLEDGKEIIVGECALKMFKPTMVRDGCVEVPALWELNPYHSIFILGGSIQGNGFPFLGAGDGTDPKNLKELVSEFGYKELTLLGIRRC